MQVGFVLSPYVKLDQMLSFFNNRAMQFEKFGLRQKKANFHFCDEDIKSETTLAGLVSGSICSMRIPEMSRFHTHWHAVADWLSLSDQFINDPMHEKISASLKEYSVHAIWYVKKIIDFYRSQILSILKFYIIYYECHDHRKIYYSLKIYRRIKYK